MVRLTVTAKVVISRCAVTANHGCTAASRIQPTVPPIRGHNQPRHRSSSLLDMGVRRQ